MDPRQLSLPVTFLSLPPDLTWWFCVSPLPTPIPSTMSRPCGTQKSSISAPELLSFWWAASWTFAMLIWKPLTGPGDPWLGRGTGAQGEGRGLGIEHCYSSQLSPEVIPLTLTSPSIWSKFTSESITSMLHSFIHPSMSCIPPWEQSCTISHDERHLGEDMCENICMKGSYNFMMLL